MLISIVAASVVAGPSAAAAAYVANADKVDNKHAVGSGATITARKGKLVATDPTTGLLPNNLIAKVLDSDKLDGFDSAAFQRRISGTCAAGMGLTAVQADGNVSCAGFLGTDGKAADAAKLDGRTLDGIRTRESATPTAGNQSLTGTAAPLSSITVYAPTAGIVVVSGLAGVYTDRLSGSGVVDVHFTVNSASHTHGGFAGAGHWQIPSASASGAYYNTLPVTGRFGVNQGSNTFYLVGSGSNAMNSWSTLNAQFFPN